MVKARIRAEKVAAEVSDDWWTKRTISSVPAVLFFLFNDFLHTWT